MNYNGWMINLSGSSVPVYEQDVSLKKKIATITKNECFTEWHPNDTNWEGGGRPVFLLNSSHNYTYGMIDYSLNNFGDFCDYASDGSSWIKVSTTKRKLVSETKLYYKDGHLACSLPKGTYVWIDPECTSGYSHPNYISVTKVQTPAGVVYNFSDSSGFIDLIPTSNTWLNVGSIILRKA